MGKNSIDKGKRQYRGRLVALGVAALACALVVTANLFSLQIIHGDEYDSEAHRLYTYTSPTDASRGTILDRYGNELAGNETVYTLRIDYALWDVRNQNATILKLYNLVQDDEEGAEVNSNLPIRLSGGVYSYTSSKGESEYDSLMSFAKEKGFGEKLSAKELMNRLYEEYEISEDYSASERCAIAGVRYQMEQEQFSLYNPFTFATDISIDLVTKVKEQQSSFLGVDVDTKSSRTIETENAANILGYVGPIYAEDWAEYKEKGYSMNAQVGKTGLESALEEYLRGTNGERSIRTDSQGNVLSVEENEPAKSGNHCVLTLDIELQRAAENALARRCQAISGAGGGAAVVIDVKTGAVRALANYPTYNLETFNQDYNELVQDELSPLLNRSIASVYAPGSTFKPLTAVAGLEEGVITGTTRQYCSGIYTYYNDYQPHCWNHSGHGSLNVVGALANSCNVFFYETGRRLGGETLEKWEKEFGLGEYTGIELSGEKKGNNAGPANRKKMIENGSSLGEWSGGDTIQAAIGQSDHAYTPLQLCNYIATIANGGTHYATHLLSSVKSYDFSETVYVQKPEVLNQLDVSESTWELVKEGMKDVTEDGTASAVFSGYPIEIGGKSGTAQRGAGKQDNGLFVAFAPYDDPEIAVCVVIEGGTSGNSVAPAVRSILDAYFFSDSSGRTEENTNGRYDVVG
ncbi:MAG: penicillin-binding transpeptidase domain-containing protein [Butyricicoccaceae bacterium]